MFNAEQLNSISQQLNSSSDLSSAAFSALQQDLHSAVHQIKQSITSDIHRMAQYEAHIERLSTELMEARSNALELQQQLTAQGHVEEDLQRHVGLLRSKEARLEAQVAELEAHLERRSEQLEAAEERAAELKEHLEGADERESELKEHLEALSAELWGAKAQLKAAQDAVRAQMQRADDLEAQLGAVRYAYYRLANRGRDPQRAGLEAHHHNVLG